MLFHLRPAAFPVALLILAVAAQQHLINAQTLDPAEIQNEVLQRLAALMASTPSSDPFIFRLDQIAEELVERAQNGIADEQQQIDFVANGLSVTDAWPSLLAGGDLNPTFAQVLLGTTVPPDEMFAQNRQQFLDEDRDLETEVLDAYNAVAALAAPEGQALLLDPAPFYMTSYGYLDGTNAATSLSNSGGGRCFSYYNLNAHRMLRPDYFQIAVRHETFHCLQDLTVPVVDLWHRTLREGVATYLTSLTTITSSGGDISDFTEQDLLFWSDSELQAAVEHHDDILAAFAADRHSNDPAVVNQWYSLGIPLASVPGAPSRCAYYVGWRALQAYAAEKHNGAFGNGTDDSEWATHLLEIVETPEGREEIWQALAEAEFEADPIDTDTSSRAFAFHNVLTVALSLWGTLVFIAVQ